jgi:Ni/Co efflux regulator RcnB
MKSRLLVASALLALVTASPAFAERHDNDDSSSDDRPRPSRDAGPHGDQPDQTVRPEGGMRAGRGDNGTMAPATDGMRGDRRDNGTNTMTRPRGGMRPNSGADMMSPRGGAMGTGAQVHNRAFDSMRRVFNAPRRFHFGTYQRPNGWYWHRWRYGEFLPGIFFARNYWILDWEDFALDDPPPGTVWVRYGDDAILIDEYTGEVIQVVYGIFY